MKTPAYNKQFATMAGVIRANGSAILEVSLPRAQNYTDKKSQIFNKNSAISCANRR